jgi:hypothetical protein
LSSTPGFKRKAPSRVVKQKILIACEDAKSSRFYLDALRKDLRLPAERLVLVPHSCTDPKGIVESVIDARAERIREKTFGEGDSAWAVFDGDEHRDRDLNNWNTALQRAKSKKIHLAISNPSFELWLLLHFQDQFGPIHRDGVCHRLKEHLGSYDKARGYYLELKQHLERAMQRAEALQTHPRDPATPFCNPSTGIYALIQAIRSMA